MNIEPIFHLLGVIVVVCPLVLLACLGLSSLFAVRLSESIISRLTQFAVTLSLIPAVTILVLMLVTDLRFVSVDIGDWVAIPQQRFHFHLKFIFDRLSVPFLLLSLVLCGVVGAFTRRYLHREAGYHRFFLLYSLFLSGMVLSSVAGTIETLFFGWEMVGLSSALLVAYFHERESPVRNGQRVWSVYRLADAAFLIGALTMGRKSTGLEAVAWAKEVQRLGAGEIVLTCMDADGTKNGFDLEITRAVADAVEIPVVASGGAGSPQHMLEAVTTGGASAALAASIFHYGEYTIAETKRYMAERGVPMRV